MATRERWRVEWGTTARSLDEALLAKSANLEGDSMLRAAAAEDPAVHLRHPALRSTPTRGSTRFVRPALLRCSPKLD